MMKISLISFAILNLLPHLGWADAFEKCMDSAGGVTIKMRECTNIEDRRLDKILNETYKKLMVKFQGDRKESLIEAQRAWINFRRKNTDHGFMGEGTAALLAGDSIWINMTKVRIQELEALLKSEL